MMNLIDFIKKLKQTDQMMQDLEKDFEKQMHHGEPDITDLRSLKLSAEMSSSLLQETMIKCSNSMDEIYNFIKNFTENHADEKDPFIVDKYRAFMQEKLADWNYCKNLQTKLEKLERIKNVCKEPEFENDKIKRATGGELSEYYGDVNDI